MEQSLTENMPIEGTLWKHRNGNLYCIVAVANLPDEERYPKTVVYKNVKNGTVWARRYDDWHRSFTFYTGD